MHCFYDTPNNATTLALIGVILSIPSAFCGRRANLRNDCKILIPYYIRYKPDVCFIASAFMVVF